jgi:hypothetical protein
MWRGHFTQVQGLLDRGGYTCLGGVPRRKKKNNNINSVAMVESISISIEWY